MIEHRIAAHGGDHARGDAQDEREHDRAQRELDRRRKKRDEFGEDRRLRDHRLAEVAVEHPPDVDAVLHEDRPVEPVFLEQRLVAGGVDAALAGHGLDRIAGHEPDQEEREQRHPDERRNDEAEASQ